MISSSFDKLHTRLAATRGGDPVFTVAASGRKGSAAPALTRDIAPTGAEKRAGSSFASRLIRLIARRSNSAAPARTAKSLAVEPGEPVDAGPQKQILTPRIRMARPVPLDVVLTSVRLGSGVGDIPRLSRRATARLQRDPFVQRLDRLRQA
ncbi:MAG: hypothetical protein AAGJ91_08105 [Pseudomonadota bacterium]